MLGLVFNLLRQYYDSKCHGSLPEVDRQYSKAAKGYLIGDTHRETCRKLGQVF